MKNNDPKTPTNLNTPIMSDKWPTHTLPYKNMVKRHRPFWEFLENFILTHNISTIMDVGGGIGYARKYTTPDKYVLIDANIPLIRTLKISDPSLIAHDVDFVTADLSGYSNYDLILMCAVAEHYRDLLSLLKKSLSLYPRFIIITFFKRLRERDMIRNNHRLFSRHTVEGYMKELNVGYEILSTIPDIKYPKHTIYEDILIVHV